jgi:Rad4 beta-hairpin domain 3/Rad4 beta-hairpin domain 2/Rad4 transglutaminase-like domain/Rad4 beta-hairpin domain 1/Histone-lysine N-methyltransferase NSD-like, PHD zinc finger 1
VHDVHICNNKLQYSTQLHSTMSRVGKALQQESSTALQKTLRIRARRILKEKALTDQIEKKNSPHLRVHTSSESLVSESDSLSDCSDNKALHTPYRTSRGWESHDSSIVHTSSSSFSSSSHAQNHLKAQKCSHLDHGKVTRARSRAAAAESDSDAATPLQYDKVNPELTFNSNGVNKPHKTNCLNDVLGDVNALVSDVMATAQLSSKTAPSSRASSSEPDSATARHIASSSVSTPIRPRVPNLKVHPDDEDEEIHDEDELAALLDDDDDSDSYEDEHGRAMAWQDLPSNVDTAVGMNARVMELEQQYVEEKQRRKEEWLRKKRESANTKKQSGPPRANAEEKKLCLQLHQAHMTCLAIRDAERSMWCNDPMLQAYLLSVLPADLHIVPLRTGASNQTGHAATGRKKRKLSSASTPDDTHVVDQEYFLTLSKWLTAHVRFASGKPLHVSCSNDRDAVCRCGVQQLICAFEQGSGGQEHIVLLMVALLRALGIHARYTVSWLPISAKPDMKLKFGSVIDHPTWPSRSVVASHNALECACGKAPAYDMPSSVVEVYDRPMSNNSYLSPSAIADIVSQIRRGDSKLPITTSQRDDAHLVVLDASESDSDCQLIEHTGSADSPIVVAVATPTAKTERSSVACTTDSKLESVGDENGMDTHDDACRACKEGGELLCCDLCPRTYHLRCVDLDTVPEGDWVCTDCSTSSTKLTANPPLRFDKFSQQLISSDSESSDMLVPIIRTVCTVIPPRKNKHKRHSLDTPSKASVSKRSKKDLNSTKQRSKRKRGSRYHSTDSTDSDSTYASPVVDEDKSANQEPIKKASFGRRPVGIASCWVEAFSPSQSRWIHIDPTHLDIDKPTMYDVPRAERTVFRFPDNVPFQVSSPLMYVMAFATVPGSVSRMYCKEVTSRYAAKWSTVSKRRFKGASEWIKAQLEPLVAQQFEESDPFHDHKSLQPSQSPTQLRADVPDGKAEDSKLELHKYAEGVPKTLSAAKDHPLYICEKHLKKFEMIYPQGDEHSVGIINTKSQGYHLFLRSHLHLLHTADRWIRLGRQVRDGEIPVKHVKKISMRRRGHRGDAGDAAAATQDETSALFGRWQTNQWQRPAASNGNVPRSVHGNVDMWTPEHLPIGCVHMNMPRAAAAARKLKIDYAPAMTGFEVKKGRSVPKLEGIVICSEYESSFLEMYKLIERQRAERAAKRRVQKISTNWRKLVKTVIVRDMVIRGENVNDTSAATAAVAMRSARNRFTQPSQSDFAVQHSEAVQQLDHGHEDDWSDLDAPSSTLQSTKLPLQQQHNSVSGQSVRYNSHCHSQSENQGDDDDELALDADDLQALIDDDSL